MIGISDAEYAAIRFEHYAQEVLAPAVHRRRAALELSMAQRPREPGPFDPSHLDSAEFRPVRVGERWGPVWSTAWFRLRGAVPADYAGETVALHFSSGTEAMLRRDGRCVRGLDANHPMVQLWRPAAGGEAVDLLVEAACNMPLGASTFFWDDPEVRRRWTEERPGRVEAAELCTVDEALWGFLQQYELARHLAVELGEADPRCWELLRGLREITRQLDPREVAASAAAVLPVLEQLLRGKGPRGVSRCVAVGHAHIDTAWLWPIRETRRKVARSWSNVLELMDRHPAMRFVASQPAQYAMLQQDAPELFDRLSQRVREGRFEPQGGMWVEPDCTVPSGESLIRQVLHGTAWFGQRFGEAAPQSVLFLPDTFGFPAALPQIARLSGLHTFVTNKMSWCERNAFPFATFRWRGLDGTELLSHFTPGQDYNARLSPRELRGGEQRLVRKDATTIGRHTAMLDLWLQPYGHGDGGGGPDEESVVRADLCAEIEGLPAVEHGGLGEFAQRLHLERQRVRDEQGLDLPVWDGELYLELHRGTATSQAWIKRANLQAERRLRRLEALQALHGPPPAEEAARTAEVWRTVLLHQFHDILPGTSIGAVYDDAREAFAGVQASLDALEAAALQRAAQTVPGAGETVVFHPASHRRDAVVEVEGRALLLRDLEPLELRRIDLGEPGLGACDPGREARAEGWTLENEFLRLRLDEAGAIAELWDKRRQRRLNAPAGGGAANSKGEQRDAESPLAKDLRASPLPLNRLLLCVDRPRRWEAWDVDHDLHDRMEVLDGPADEIRVVQSGPLRATIEVRRRVHASTIIQRYVLCAHSPRLEIETEVDWREERRLLQSEWALDLRTREATCGTQFGHLRRPSHRNTSHEEAQFEFAAHRWVDLSERGLGLSLWDDGKWGHSVQDSVLRLSLLRAPNFPDPSSDRGLHRFCYGVIVHGGDPIAARVPALADEAVDPPWVLASPAVPEPAVPEAAALQPAAANPASTDPASTGSASQLCARRPFRCLQAEEGRIEIAAYKPAEQGGASILRLVERGGGRCTVQLQYDAPTAAPQVVDLLERSRAEGGLAPALPGFEHPDDGLGTRFELGAFQIVTLRYPAGPSPRKLHPPGSQSSNSH